MLYAVNLRQMPNARPFRRMRYTANTVNRHHPLRNHALFYIQSGAIRFETENRTDLVEEGMTFLLPSGTNYVSVVERDCDFYYLHFQALPLRAIHEKEEAAAYEMLRTQSTSPTQPFYFLPNAPDEVLLHTPAPAPESLAYLFGRAGELISSTNPMELLALDILLCRILHALAAAEMEAADAAASNPTYIRLRRHILNHFNEPISLSSLADEFGLSRQYVARLFRENADETVTAFITRCRLNRALVLLRFTTLNISEIAFATGFTSAAYFCRSFRRTWGMTPGSYRATMPD